MNPWEAFYVKFLEAQRHVRKLGEWEGRELLLEQLPQDLRFKLITEEDKRSRLRVSIRGLPRTELSVLEEFFKKHLGLTITRVKCTNKGYEAQVNR